ncbi:L,D-transpeptidase family protein [Sinorhizobium meliloti]|uniref:L,D-transpeptidase family protein n=1 Tax=Rhizobium meliloti TaxID=382 RepID=UPI000367E818|nr:L,D-transpeptidase family protein [Sinorhizobium meliloti]MDE3766683.1 L,D-transpeptidase family protein [Sinorhizobium meliloti]MDE3780690.1 L,D-transpeptidase family protein [Sinorhizobium meliloti]MDE3808312.1 L,D-transpeptidase family protein [Sinorhizobium meliloti]
MRFALRMGFAVFVMASPSALAAGAKTPLQVVVSRDQQSLVVYDGDTVVATSKVSTGKAGHATPTGIFSILEKRRRHESNIYSNAPMPFMQRLTWSGIALHGSNHVPDYPASHGCVRLPGKFAASLFKMTGYGMHVVISDRQIAPVEVASEMLFQPSESRPKGPALSDVPLRPAIGEFNQSAVEVAMTDKRPSPVTSDEEKVPIRILITRRGTQESVRDLQTLLNTLGYDAGLPDGFSGPATAAAIEAFQRAEGLPVEGKITPELIEAVFRKAGHSAPLNGVLRVRRQFQPVFEAEVAIAEPEMALGTHLLQFQDLDTNTGQGKWFGMSLENRLPKTTKKRLGITAEGEPDRPGALERTLSRITVPKDARERLAGLLANGSSLSITDTESGLETGEGTDFITVTRERRG